MYYYIKNIFGDITKIVQKDGTVVADYTYNAWGNLLSVKDMLGNAITDNSHIANVNPFRYRGYIYDNESGLYCLQSRYYDPTTGRFVNADVYQDTGIGMLGTNMFIYGANNPILFIDKNGEFNVFAFYSGMKYSKAKGIYYADNNCWQRQTGYCDMYDAVANNAVKWKYVKFFFNYSGKQWRIQLWKGQYPWAHKSGVATGAEMGVYYRYNWYPYGWFQAADSKNCLQMTMILNHKGKRIFYRGVGEFGQPKKLWWLTGWKAGLKSNPNDLQVIINMYLKDKSMYSAFMKALGNKVKVIDKNSKTNRVKFSF